MQGTILHYDSLTGCGLLRVDAHRRDDHPILFRQNQLIDARSVKAGQRISVSGSGAGLTIVTRSGETRSGETRPSDAIPDQYEELLDAEPVTYLDAKPVIPRAQPVYDQTAYTTGSGPVAPASGGLYNWPGTLVAAAAFGLLLAAGQGYKPESRVEKNVPLINSIWGMVAAALLVMTTYWQAVGMSRGRVRSAVWGVAICSIMAYLLQGCSGFVADGAAQWYIYALIVLFLIVYILPYRVRF
ncbi:hypothetical protein F5984_00695 [Rudanella paleaurantiibacter]|uniref:Uncharacterized protein n=1 Tax=Rudanella paleaurantiibacter TaxID=2614655 RepID=A0A7J5U491_9BACT|nr:hypothetical protein [Rudanella paleaurantiibacter]KAB7732513.1 hypothetical protein F5984_00695 [Rudanella paleaurantiibacter]